MLGVAIEKYYIRLEGFGRSRRCPFQNVPHVLPQANEIQLLLGSP